MLKNVGYFFLAGFVMFAVFVFFTYLVHKDVFIRLDFDTTVRLQDKLPRRLDNLFSLFSDIGSFEVTGVVLLIILLFRKKIIAGAVYLFFFAAFHVIELYGKAFVDHPPPPEFMLRTLTMVDFPQFHVRSEFSYPSGHSGRTIFLSVFLITALWYNGRLSGLLKFLMIGAILVFDGIMLISRVYLGEHWFTDVIGGALLGGSFALFGNIFYVIRRTERTPTKKYNRKISQE